MMIDVKPRELSWYENGKYVMNPENMMMTVWLNISTPIYFISLVSSTLIIGFNFYFFE